MRDCGRSIGVGMPSSRAAGRAASWSPPQGGGSAVRGRIDYSRRSACHRLARVRDASTRARAPKWPGPITLVVAPAPSPAPAAQFHHYDAALRGVCCHQLRAARDPQHPGLPLRGHGPHLRRRQVGQRGGAPFGTAACLRRRRPPQRSRRPHRQQRENNAFRGHLPQGPTPLQRFPPGHVDGTGAAFRAARTRSDRAPTAPAGPAAPPRPCRSSTL